MKLIRLINNDRALVGVNPKYIAALVEKAGTTTVVFSSGHCMEVVESFDYIEKMFEGLGVKVPKSAPLAREAKSEA